MSCCDFRRPGSKLKIPTKKTGKFLLEAIVSVTASASIKTSDRNIGSVYKFDHRRARQSQARSVACKFLPVIKMID